MNKIETTEQKKYSKTYYNERTWLNGKDTPSTGSVVCYHGNQKWPDEDTPFDNMFVEVSDCHGKIRLHKTVHESIHDYKMKIERLISSLTNYKQHLDSFNG